MIWPSASFLKSTCVFLTPITLTSLLILELAKHVLPQAIAFYYFCLELSYPKYSQCSLPHFIFLLRETFTAIFSPLFLPLKNNNTPFARCIHLFVDLLQLK